MLRKCCILFEVVLQVGGLKSSGPWNEERFELDWKPLQMALLLHLGPKVFTEEGACGFPCGWSEEPSSGLFGVLYILLTRS